MSITDPIIKKEATKFSNYLRYSQSAKYNCAYTGATSGTVTFPDQTTFVFANLEELESHIEKINTIYQSILTAATNYLEIKQLYLMAIQNMSEGGTFYNDTFNDGTNTQVRRPLSPTKEFIDWLDYKISQESFKTNGNYLRLAKYD